MPLRAFDSLRALLRTPTLRPTGASSPDPIDDVHRVAEDQAAARIEVRSILALQSRLDRAAVLSAVRHELRLPLGAGGTPPGALHLVRADDSSITLGSRSRAGTEFRGLLMVRDCTTGSRAEYAVERWHEVDGAIVGLQQLQHVRHCIWRAVRAVDADVHVKDPTLEGSE